MRQKDNDIALKPAKVHLSHFLFPDLSKRARNTSHKTAGVMQLAEHENESTLTHSLACTRPPRVASPRQESRFCYYGVWRLVRNCENRMRRGLPASSWPVFALCRVIGLSMAKSLLFQPAHPNAALTHSPTHKAYDRTSIMIQPHLQRRDGVFFFLRLDLWTSLYLCVF